MRFVLLLVWVAGTFWGIGQIVDGFRSDDMSQVVVAVLLGIVALYGVSVIFNLLAGKTWSGQDPT